MQIRILSESGTVTTLDVMPSDTISAVKSKIEDSEDIDVEDLFFGELYLDDDSRTLSDYGISNQSTIRFIRLAAVTYVRKPVIYISSPTTVHAHVSLQLKHAWSFSAIYPTTEIKIEEDGGQEIVWDVVVKPDGTLTDVISGSEISYLYWEAK
jgi:hypothetical protein